MMEIRSLFHKAGSKWPTYGIQRKNKKQTLRKSREINARGVHIRLVTNKVFLVYFGGELSLQIGLPMLLDER